MLLPDSFKSLQSGGYDTLAADFINGMRCKNAELAILGSEVNSFVVSLDTENVVCCAARQIGKVTTGVDLVLERLTNCRANIDAAAVFSFPFNTTKDRLVCSENEVYEFIPLTRKCPSSLSIRKHRVMSANRVLRTFAQIPSLCHVRSQRQVCNDSTYKCCFSRHRCRYCRTAMLRCTYRRAPVEMFY